MSRKALMIIALLGLIALFAGCNTETHHSESSEEPQHETEAKYFKTDDGEVISDFLFYSGINGWQIEKENHYMKIFYKADAVYIYLNYENDLPWFEANREKILSTAKTLRDNK